MVPAGLGYGSGSEDDESGEEEGQGQRGGDHSEGSDSSDEDDAVLQERIRRKRVEFERKMREQEAMERGLPLVDSSTKSTGDFP